MKEERRMDKVLYEFLIFGKVQGVGYRRFVKSKVEQINLQGVLIEGSIKNLEDGSVRVIVRGDEETIQTLRRYLEVGPVRSSITQIQSRIISEDECKEHTFNLNGFNVIE